MVSNGLRLNLSFRKLSLIVELRRDWRRMASEGGERREETDQVRAVALGWKEYGEVQRRTEDIPNGQTVMVRDQSWKCRWEIVRQSIDH